MSFSSFLPPHHILQYPLLEEWIFDFVLLGANDISLLRQAKGGTRKGARWQLSVLYSIASLTDDNHHILVCLAEIQPQTLIIQIMRMR